MRAAERLFIVGGGNVGLIAGYHALQAGIEVVGLVEALPECGGYKVHKDKLARMGVPIYTSHTILSANGTRTGRVGDDRPGGSQFQADPGHRTIVRLRHRADRGRPGPGGRVLPQGAEFGMTVFAAGDAEEIAEASAAMFSGKIKGLEMARALGHDVGEIPPDWFRTAEILRSKPGATIAEQIPEDERRRLPGLPLHAGNPLQPVHLGLLAGLIHIDENDIRALPALSPNSWASLHRLREVRHHLPGPGHHPGGLPQGCRRTRP